MPAIPCLALRSRITANLLANLVAWGDISVRTIPMVRTRILCSSPSLPMPHSVPRSQPHLAFSPPFAVLVEDPPVARAGYMRSTTASVAPASRNAPGERIHIATATIGRSANPP